MYTVDTSLDNTHTSQEIQKNEFVNLALEESQIISNEPHIEKTNRISQVTSYLVGFDNLEVIVNDESLV